MNIGLLNVQIKFQKTTVATDSIGNHTNTWTDYYTCRATVSGENGSINGGEDEKAGTVIDHSNTDFTVRWCDKTKVIVSDEYRVVFNGESYNIIGIDHMNYKRKCIKFRCKKVLR